MALVHVGFVSAILVLGFLGLPENLWVRNWLFEPRHRVLM